MPELRSYILLQLFYQSNLNVITINLNKLKVSLKKKKKLNNIVFSIVELRIISHPNILMRSV